MNEKLQQIKDQLSDGEMNQFISSFVDDEQLDEARQMKSVEIQVFGSTQTIEITKSEMKHLVANPTSQGNIPSDRDIYLFMKRCQAKGLNPLDNDCYLIGYDGRNGPEFSLVVSVYALLKRAELNPNNDGMESGISLLNKKTGEITHIDGQIWNKKNPDLELIGAWCRGYRKDRSHSCFKSVLLHQYEKGNKMWGDYRESMIEKVAIAAMLRYFYPGETGGLYVAEEMADQQTQEAARLTSGRQVDLDDVPDIESNNDVGDDSSLGDDPKDGLHESGDDDVEPINPKEKDENKPTDKSDTKKGTTGKSKSSGRSRKTTTKSKDEKPKNESEEAPTKDQDDSKKEPSELPEQVDNGSQQEPDDLFERQETQEQDNSDAKANASNSDLDRLFENMEGEDNLRKVKAMVKTFESAWTLTDEQKGMIAEKLKVENERCRALASQAAKQ